MLSAEPQREAQPPVIGPDLIHSSTIMREAQTEVKDALASSAGIRRLGKMAATKSITKNLAAEDADVQRESDAYHNELFGIEGTNEAASGGEAMDIMAARDVIVNQPPAPIVAPVSPLAPGMSTTAKIATALTAAVILGPGGVWLANYLGAFDSPDAADTATQIEATQLYEPRE